MPLDALLLWFRKRPDPPGVGARRAGTCHLHPLAGADDISHSSLPTGASLAPTALATGTSRHSADSALRLAARGTRIDLALPRETVTASSATAALAAAVSQAKWRLG